MFGMLFGPSAGTKMSFLASIYRAMTLRNEGKDEFIGANKAMGDLQPIITRWLEQDQFTITKHPHNTKDTRFEFTLHVHQKSMTDHLQFWKDQSSIHSTCLSVHYPSSNTFSQKTVDHLKKSEYLILCDSFSSIPKTNHFESLSRLFLQMTSLDCPLRRVAFVVHYPHFQVNAKLSPVDVSKHIFGTEVYEVFKTFCGPRTLFDFFLIDPFKVATNTQRPYTVEHWLPIGTAEAILFALKGHKTSHLLTMKQMESTWTS